jgi:hypothetical protein
VTVTVPHFDLEDEHQDGRPALAIHLDLGRGPGAAAARVEFHGRVASVGLSGSIAAAALRRFERLMTDLAARDLAGLVLDCSRLGPVDDRSFARLIRAVAPFARDGGLEVRGLPTRLRERLRALKARTEAAGAAAAARRGGRRGLTAAVPVGGRGRAS